MVEHQLEPITETGRRVVDMAETHGADAWEHAAERDREGRFPTEAFDAMRESGLLAAPVPEELGGMGLTSVHDLAVALERLGRGDGSVAIATNMHMSFAISVARLWRGAREAGDAGREEAFGALLGMLGQGAVMMANITEPGTDITHPLVEGEPTEGGWTIRGRKIFGTLSEVADIFFVTFRAHDPGGDRTRAGLVFRGAPGQEIGYDWDAVGMRASGSHSILYDGCHVPEEQLMPDRPPWGEQSMTLLLVGTVGQIGLYGAFLGIAERAAQLARDHARNRTKAPEGRPMGERPGVQHLVAEIEIAVSTGRAMLHRLGLLQDEVFGRPVAEVGRDDMTPVARETQCAKLVINRSAMDAVDGALSVSGGGGYMTGNPLSRLYRDVRAGPFMQPYGPAEAYEFIGRTALGL